MELKVTETVVPGRMSCKRRSSSSAHQRDENTAGSPLDKNTSITPFPSDGEPDMHMYMYSAYS